MDNQEWMKKARDLLDGAQFSEGCIDNEDLRKSLLWGQLRQADACFQEPELTEAPDPEVASLREGLRTLCVRCLDELMGEHIATALAGATTLLGRTWDPKYLGSMWVYVMGLAQMLEALERYSSICADPRLQALRAAQRALAARLAAA